LKSKNILLNIVVSALSRVYKDHSYLIENRVSERSIVFWFGIYVYDLKKDTFLKDFDLDIEYNRNKVDQKRTQNFPNGSFPDLILHKRGTNDSNLLIIEFKTWWNENNSNDLIKLQDFTSAKGKYKFKIGLSILIDKEKPFGIILENRKVVGRMLYV
jgi:hypothetical protein